MDCLSNRGFFRLTGRQGWDARQAPRPRSRFLWRGRYRPRISGGQQRNSRFPSRSTTSVTARITKSIKSRNKKNKNENTVACRKKVAKALAVASCHEAVGESGAVVPASAPVSLTVAPRAAPISLHPTTSGSSNRWVNFSSKVSLRTRKRRTQVPASVRPPVSYEAG